MLNKIFSLVAIAYLAISSTSASPIKDRGYHYDLRRFEGDWYAEATSPAIYEAFEKWYRSSGYSCECVKTHLKADSDSRLDMTVSCDLHKDDNLIGHAAAVGYLDLYDYKDGLYSFKYKNEEVYYTSEDEPDKKHTVNGIYDYYQDDVSYYTGPNNGTDRYQGILELSTYEDKTYSTLYTFEYIDEDTLDKVIKAMGQYGIDIVKIDTSKCH